MSRVPTVPLEGEWQLSRPYTLRGSHRSKREGDSVGSPAHMWLSLLGLLPRFYRKPISVGYFLQFPGPSSKAIIYVIRRRLKWISVRGERGSRSCIKALLSKFGALCPVFDLCLHPHSQAPFSLRNTGGTISHDMVSSRYFQLAYQSRSHCF